MKEKDIDDLLEVFGCDITAVRKHCCQEYEGWGGGGEGVLEPLSLIQMLHCHVYCMYTSCCIFSHCDSMDYDSIQDN